MFECGLCYAAVHRVDLDGLCFSCSQDDDTGDDADTDLDGCPEFGDAGPWVGMDMHGHVQGRRGARTRVRRGAAVSTRLRRVLAIARSRRTHCDADPACRRRGSGRGCGCGCTVCNNIPF